jgi:hypothetical protein
MATVSMTKLIDDLDGSAADVTVTLVLESKRYRVDLSKANYREYIAPLVKVATPSRRGRPPKQSDGSSVRKRAAARTPSKATTFSRLSGDDQVAIREYLRRTRGRISDREVTSWRSEGKP